MGADGGSAPTGLTKRQASTLYLRAPSSDWAALMQGAKTEFRVPFMGVGAENIQVPTPVVIYSRTSRGLKTELMVLVDHQRQRLIDISEDPQALMREGMPSYGHFRSYWRRRTRRPYRPLDRVEVFTLAPWPKTNQLAIDQLGRKLLERLYGEHMPRAAYDVHDQ